MPANLAIKTTFRAVDRMTAPIKRMTSAMNAGIRRARASTMKLSSSLDGMAKKMSSSMKSVVGTAGLAATSLALIAKPGADFEQAITDVGAVSLKTRAQIAALEEKAKELGSTTKFTATESATAMEIMARAGFTQEQILSGVDGVLSAAAASGLEMAEVAGVVSNTLKGMGLAATDANTGLSNTQRIADVLTVASSKTNSTFGSLGESMSKLAPVASQFNISLEDSVRMVALMQDVGIDASEAGTSVATMLTKLTKPTAAVKRSMLAMGVSFTKAGGDMKSPVELFDEMMKVSGKLPGNMDKVAFFSELVGMRGQRAALQLQRLFNSKQGEELKASLDGASGSAEKMAKLKMDTLTGDLTLLESAADAVRIAFFETDGALRPIVQGVTAWVVQNKELIASKLGLFLKGMLVALPRIFRLVTNVAKAYAAFKVAAGAVWLLSNAMAFWGMLVKGAMFLTKAYTATQLRFALATGATAGGLTSFAIALGTVVLPLVVIAGTIAFVITQFQKLQKLLVGEDGSTWDLVSRMMSGQSLTEASDSIMNEQAMARFERKKLGLGEEAKPGSLGDLALNATGHATSLDMDQLLGILEGKGMPGMGGGFDINAQLNAQTKSMAPELQGIFEQMKAANDQTASMLKGEGMPEAAQGGIAQVAPEQFAQMTESLAGLAEQKKNARIEIVVQDPSGSVEDVRKTQGSEGVSVRRTGTD